MIFVKTCFNKNDFIRIHLSGKREKFISEGINDPKDQNFAGHSIALLNFRWQCPVDFF